MRTLPFLLIILAVLMACSKEGKEVLIEAHLIDDLSSLELTFYQDSSFVQRSNGLTGKKIENSGTYTIREKEIWIYGEIEKKITPDILYIYDDKLIVRNDIKEKSDTTFASFYRIKTNTIRKAQ